MSFPPIAFKTCNTELEPLFKFVYSQQAGVYVNQGQVDTNDLGDQQPSDDSTNGNRLLRSSTMSFPHEELSMFPIFAQPNKDNHGPSSSEPIERQLLSDADGSILFGRPCVCSKQSDVYCPVGARLCRVRHPGSRVNELITCEGETQDMFARFMFPFVGFLFVFFGCLLCGSPKGRYALGYARKFFCCWNNERYQQALQDDLDRMARTARQRRERLLRLQALQTRNPNRVYVPRSGPTLDHLTGTTNSPLSRPTEADIVIANRRAVVLKTRKYQPPDITAKAEEDECRNDQCSICLLELERGDRVGDLLCGHVFHVECLKSWIQRKNHCPLCHAEDLARPQQAQLSDSAVEMTVPQGSSTTQTEENNSSSPRSCDPDDSGEISAST